VVELGMMAKRKPYQNYKKEELIAEIQKLKKHKKYGLVWEEKKEEVVEMCKDKLPVLKEVKKREIVTDKNKPMNLLIEGDNYHSLSVLNYTHQKKIDVIYIDPPYNTGTKDWKYNNKYVDENDAYRHSKWLSFMNNRLKVAKNLLSDRGVLICTIDHNEQENLGLLLREVFPHKELVCITIVHNPAGIQGKNFSYTHEFAYFVFPKNGEFIGKTTRKKELTSPLRDWGNDSERVKAKNCFYPIIIRDKKIVGFGNVCKKNFHPKSSNIKKKDGSIYVYPIDKNNIERKWVFNKSSAEKNIDKLFCKKVNGKFTIMRKKSLFKYRTVWIDKKYYANIYGTKLVNSIIRAEFPFPKSLYAVMDCIKAVIHDRDNSIILDFFAGSGTTGHAVIKLNREDGGNRKFILCTDNENNICTNVCYPRVKKIIRGYTDSKGKKIKGLGGNLKYFKTDFVDAEPTDKNKKKLTEQAIEMLCVKEGTYESVLNRKKFKIFKNNKHYTGIILDQLVIPQFKKTIKGFKGRFSVYVFSLGDDTFEEEFSDIKQKVRLSPIPEAILRVYRRIFR